MTCTDSGACASTHLSVLPDGSASHCGRSADWGLLDYGSIHEKSFSQIFSDPQREVLRRRQAVLPETECQGLPLLGPLPRRLPRGRLVRGGVVSP